MKKLLGNLVKIHQFWHLFLTNSHNSGGNSQKMPQFPPIMIYTFKNLLPFMIEKKTPLGEIGAI